MIGTENFIIHFILNWHNAYYPNKDNTIFILWAVVAEISERTVFALLPKQGILRYSMRVVVAEIFERTVLAVIPMLRRIANLGGV